MARTMDDPHRARMKPKATRQSTTRNMAVNKPGRKSKRARRSVRG